MATTNRKGNPVSRRLTLTALVATAAALTAAPAALAHSPVGDSSGTPTQNICLLDFQCTYVNYKNGRPTDVVGRTGTIRSWTVRAGSVGGRVRLRVLRPVAGGRLHFVRSSVPRTITDDFNSFPYVSTFPASLRVRKGDVLAMTNTSSGIYMAVAPASRAIRYFDYASDQADGATGAPDRTVPALRMLLSARVAG